MARKGKWSVEQKTEIVLANLRGDAGVSELARKHRIAASQIHSWKAEFLSAGQAALGHAEGKAETKQLEAKVEKFQVENPQSPSCKLAVRIFDLESSRCWGVRLWS